MTTSRVSIDALPSAFDRLDAIVRAARDRRVTLFLDFDGTLSPIVDRPEEALLPAPTRALLANIAKRRTVAVVSGRDLEDVRDRVGLDDVIYAGCHGFRLSGPGGLDEEHPAAAASLPALERAARRLASSVGGIRGVQIERKRFGIAVHYRRAGEGVAGRVSEAVERAVSGESSLRVTRGRKVREVRPAVDWDKGRAIAWIEEVLGLDRNRLYPIFVGDDVTDEDAFRAVAGRGIGIVVRGREGESAASCVLDDPDAVRRFLAAFDERLGAGER